MHTREKRLWWSLCDKRFVQKSTATVHTRVHTGALPFYYSTSNQMAKKKKEEKFESYPAPNPQITLCPTL